LKRFIEFKNGFFLIQKNKNILLAVIVGASASIVAGILKTLTHTIQNLVCINVFSTITNFYLLIYPTIGILLTLLFIKIFRKGHLEKGLSGIIYSSTLQEANIPSYQIYSQAITSSLTIGFGGSVGLEAPSVLTGAAVGSNIGKLFNASYKTKLLLLGCGASSTIASIFNSPIAGIIFCLEVLMLDFSITHLIPLLISTAVSVFISKILFSHNNIFFSAGEWNSAFLPFYIFLGIFGGFISAYMIKTTLKIEEFFSEYRSYWLKGIICSLLLGVLIFLFPPLYGEGYYFIKSVLENNSNAVAANSIFYNYLKDDYFFLIFILAIIFLKSIASALTISAGGNGGIFAPSLFVGCFSGFFVVKLSALLGLANLNTSEFCALGMAAIISGVIKAPLTGIFLIAEITGGYQLFPPLMIVSSISFLISRSFEKYSIYTKLLAERKNWNPEDKESKLLKQIKATQLIENDFLAIQPKDTLKSILQNLSKTKRNLFPVVDSQNNLLGIVSLDNIREHILNSELYEFILAQDLMERAPNEIHPEDNLESIIKKFELTKSWNLPVVSDGKYLGFISKSSIFKNYREAVKDSEQVLF